MNDRRRLRWIVAAALAVGAAGAQASAQTLTIDGTGARTVQAAPDYAAEVIGDPWDFDAPGDYDYTYSLGEDTPEDGGNEYTTWQPYPTHANGVFTGITRERYPTLQMLFGGIPGAMNAVQRTGIRYPVDAGRYVWLSFRVRRSWAAGGSEMMKVLWEKGRRAAGTPIGLTLFLARGYDNDTGRWVNQAPVASQGAANEWQIYRIRLSDVSGYPSNRFAGTAWQGTVNGLGLTLGDGPIGSTVQMDWVRLTAPRTVTLAWSSLGGNVVITASNGAQTVQVFPEDLRPYADGSNPRVATGAFPDNSSITWDYGHLTPGTWTIRAQGASATRTATLTVQSVPHFTVLNPDETGGQDMATTLIGDPWDLNNPEDVLRYSTPQNALHDVRNPVFGPTGLKGTAYHSGMYGAPHSDSQVRFFDDDLGERFSLTPEQARRFHRLTFTLDYDIPVPAGYDPLAPDPFLSDWSKNRPGVGGMARVLWRTAAHRGGAFAQTCALVVRNGGPITVTLDLSQYGTADPTCATEGLQTLPSGQAWGALASNLANFRIDINEGRLDVPFTLSNVKLAADDEPDESGTFVVQWAAAAAPYTALPTTAVGEVAIYIDTDRNPGNGRTLVAEGLNASVGAYVWDLARTPGGVAPGTYWVYVEMTRGGYTWGKYSTGPLQVTRTYDPPLTLNEWKALYGINDMSGDADGDGVTNQEEFDRGTSPLVPNRWELAEGSTGFFTERIALANPENRAAIARVTVLFGQMPQLGEAAPPMPVVQDIPIAAYGRHTVNVNGLPNATYQGHGRAVSVIVETLRGAVIAERTMSWGDDAWGGHTGKALLEPRHTWFLAEGAATDFFETFVLITSTSAAPPTVTVDYLMPDGSVITEVHRFPSSPARLTLWTNQNPRLYGQSFSTRITSTQPITVERAMYFNRGARAYEGGHASAGIPDAATRWFVAEGATGPNFDTYLLLANPGTARANVTVRYLTPEGPYTATYSLRPTSRETLYVDLELSRVSGRDAIGSQVDVSAEIVSDQPIVVERAMYWFGEPGNWTDAHNSAGVTSTSTLWGLAEGERGGTLGHETFVLLANPSASAASVRLRLLREGGKPSILSAPVSVAPGSRYTCYAGQPGPCMDAFGQLQDGERFGVLVESTNGVPIVVERALYWNGGGEFLGAGTNETGIQLR